MEISKMHISGREVNVIFTGAQYIFHNAFFGVIAVANRLYTTDKAKQNFEIDIDNFKTIGSRCNYPTIATAVKRYITKEENKFVPTNVEYQINEGCEINQKYNFRFSADYKYNK